MITIRNKKKKKHTTIYLGSKGNTNQINRGKNWMNKMTSTATSLTSTMLNLKRERNIEAKIPRRV